MLCPEWVPFQAPNMQRGPFFRLEVCERGTFLVEGSERVPMPIFLNLVFEMVVGLRYPYEIGRSTLLSLLIV